MLAWIKASYSSNFVLHEDNLTIVITMSNMKNIVIAPIAITSNTLEWIFYIMCSFESCPTDRATNLMLKLSQSTREMLGAED